MPLFHLLVLLLLGLGEHEIAHLLLLGGLSDKISLLLALNFLVFLRLLEEFTVEVFPLFLGLFSELLSQFYLLV